MTYTCKHCGKKVEALTICGCDMAQNEFFSGESTKPATMSYATGKLTGRGRIEELEAENERLTAELAECRQAAFENGRETERAAGYGELEY